MAKLLIRKEMRLVVLDFPRTIKPDSFREEVLIPFFRDNLFEYLQNHWESSSLKDIIRQLRIQATVSKQQHRDCPLLPPSTATKEEQINGIIRTVKWHLDGSYTVPPIIRLMSDSWTSGYKKGLIKTTVYPDVRPALESWKKLGIRIVTISSSPSFEQKIILASTTAGKLTTFFDFHVDSNAGSKDNPETYTNLVNIARAENPKKVVFFTDYVLNGRAANHAGLRVVFVNRNPVQNEPHEFVTITQLTEVEFTQSVVNSF